MEANLTTDAELKAFLTKLWDNGIELPIKIKVTQARKTSWPMKKTWRMWMSETATFMANNGATMPLVIRADGTTHGSRPFNSDDAHELWIRHWMGVDADGERYKTASGDKGEMVSMMDQHCAWAVERGLTLTIPAHSEYMKYREAQQC